MKKLIFFLCLCFVLTGKAQTVISKPGSLYTITCYKCERLPSNLFPNMYASGLLVRTPNGSVFVRSPYIIEVTGTTIKVRDMIGFNVSFTAANAGWTSASGFLSEIKDCGCAYGSGGLIEWSDLDPAVQDSILSGGMDTNLANTNLTQSASNRTYNANNFNLSFNGIATFLFNGDDANWDFGNDVLLNAGNDLSLTATEDVFIASGNAGIALVSNTDILNSATGSFGAVSNGFFLNATGGNGVLDVDAGDLTVTSSDDLIITNNDEFHTVTDSFSVASENAYFGLGASGQLNITNGSTDLSVIPFSSEIWVYSDDSLTINSDDQIRLTTQQIKLTNQVPVNNSPASIMVLDLPGVDAVVNQMTADSFAMYMDSLITAGGGGSGELNWSHSDNTSDGDHTQDIAGFDFNMVNVGNLELGSGNSTDASSSSMVVGNENNTEGDEFIYILGDRNSSQTDNMTFIGSDMVGANALSVYVGYTDGTKAEYNAAGQLDVKIGYGVNGDFGAVGEVLTADGAGGQSYQAPGAGTSGLTVTDEFTASAAQVSFTLSSAPGSKKVLFFRNGIRLSNTCYSVSGVTLTYDPAFNGGQAMILNDRVQADF